MHTVVYGNDILIVMIGRALIFAAHCIGSIKAVTEVNKSVLVCVILSLSSPILDDLEGAVSAVGNECGILEPRKACAADSVAVSAVKGFLYGCSGDLIYKCGCRRAKHLLGCAEYRYLVAEHGNAVAVIANGIEHIFGLCVGIYVSYKHRVGIGGNARSLCNYCCVCSESSLDILGCLYGKRRRILGIYNGSFGIFNTGKY